MYQRNLPEMVSYCSTKWWHIPEDLDLNMSAYSLVQTADISIKIIVV